MKSVFKNTVVLYNIFFMGISIFFFSFFVRYGKTTMWKNDGLYQHYNSFLYLGEWCRGIIKTLVKEHKLVLPMWEWGIGYGSDIITTLSYYVIGDPFALVSVFTPSMYGEAGYALAIILRMYAAGLAFRVYCKKMGCPKWSTVYAMLMYVFCCFVIYAGVRHPYFISPLIYFPLVLTGAEKIIRGESPLPFSFAVAISALSNFYFFYMIVLLTIVYVVIRLLTNEETRQLKQLFTYIFKFGMYALLGIGLASFLFVPNLINFMSNTRITGHYKFGFFYRRHEYERLLGSFIGINNGPDWSLVGMCPLAYLAAGGMFLQRKKEDKWSLWFMLVQFVFLLFPIFGYAFNGFGYVCNRWVFGWAFIVAYMFAKGMPELFKLGKGEKIKLGFFCVIYSLTCMCFDKSRAEDVMTGCVMLFISLLFIFGAEYFKETKIKQHVITPDMKQKLVSAGLVILFVCHSIFYRYSITEQDYLEQYQDVGTANEKLTTDRLRFFKADDSEFYRIDNSLNDNEVANYSLTEGKRTTSFYWSLTCPEVVNFLKENSAYKWIPYSVKGLGQRAWLLPLVSAKYFVTTGSRAALASVPYGYKYTWEAATSENSSKEYHLYESELALPFGYTYDSALDYNDFKDLSYVKKQQVMMQTAVMSNKNVEATGLPMGKIYCDDYTLKNIVFGSENAKVDGKEITVKKSNGYVTVEFTPIEGGELYILLSGVSFESKSRFDLRDKEDKKLDKYDLEKEKYSNKYWTPSDDTIITAICGDTESNITHNTDYCKYAEGRTDYLISLGYDTNWRGNIKLRFSETGVYNIDNIEVICQPLDDLQQYVEERKVDTLSDVKFDTNKITGNIELDKNKLLCLSMPYSNGWKVYVDGKKEKLICTNVMFAGVMLDAGKHDIKLVYSTPYLKEGFVISGISIAIVVIIMVMTSRKKKKEEIVSTIEAKELENQIEDE